MMFKIHDLMEGAGFGPHPRPLSHAAGEGRMRARLNRLTTGCLRNLEAK